VTPIKGGAAVDDGEIAIILLDSVKLLMF